jgi:hypothetical protein
LQLETVHVIVGTAGHAGESTQNLNPSGGASLKHSIDQLKGPLEVSAQQGQKWPAIPRGKRHAHAAPFVPSDAFIAGRNTPRMTDGFFDVVSFCPLCKKRRIIPRH